MTSPREGGVPVVDEMAIQQQLALDYEQPPVQAGVLQRRLTDEQELAVASRQASLLLAAGAGSGKTSVLVERFVRAVREDGIAPGRILAITFTERAAGELRQRVRLRLLELGEREAARETEAANVCTFHSFCARLLRIHPVQADVEPGFEILEEGIATRLRALAFSDALGDFLAGERRRAVDLAAAYGADPLRTMVLGAYAQLRSQGQVQPRLPAEPRQTRLNLSDADADALVACELIGELLERFGVRYAERKHGRGALDFDDLELNARELLETHADVRESWAERFQLLMVDEFQDSNPRQLQVLAALDRDNLFTVGDELQSIYGFRHADVGLFRERRERLARDASSLELTRNFRSLPPVLAAVKRIFAERIGEHFTALTPMRSRDEASESTNEPIVELLLTDKRGWEHFPRDEELAALPQATLWRQAEAGLLAERIAQLIASGEAQAGEVVVLLRALGDLPVYESALRRHGLRTLAGVGGFWSHQQIGDLLTWLRTLANPLDELALYSTLGSPLVGLSSDALALLARIAREQGRGVWQAILECSTELDALLPVEDRKRLGAFRELFAAERTGARLRPVSELLRRVICATGYDTHVLSLGWGERRLANVHKLIGMARRFEAQEGRDLRGFLDHVAHLEVALAGREAEAPVGDAQLDAVRLMSIHAAKGLEFPVVCVADLGREVNLRVPDLLFDEAGGRLGLRLQQLGNPESISALAYEQLRDERRLAQEEEEDRVLYVACTRAENRLLLSGSVTFERWPAVRPGSAPIAWMAPALVPDAPTLAASGQPPTKALTVDLGGGLRVRCMFHSSSVVEPQSGEGSHPDVDLDRASAVLLPNPDVLASMSHGSAGASDGSVLAPSPESVEKPTASHPLPFNDPGATMSYSSLAELDRCGYRFYVERVLRLPENRAGARTVSDDGRAQARRRGTIVHGLLESIDFARPKQPSLEDVAEVARRIGAKLSAEEREEIAGLIAAALASEPARLLGTARRARREYPFAFSLDGEEPLVTGVFDLLVEQSDGSSLIVDYKSDRLAAGEDLEMLVQREYGFQRLLYALAAIEDGASRVQIVHWFLERPSEWVAATFDCGEGDDLRELLLERVARIRAKGFAVTEAPNRGVCLTCPARGGLCSWGETRTMSERSATLESDG
ncbi:MAG TPA: UvrD-helicase domain-containing protein [Solirubrobacteraceae bacterium]|jgi:ATP-dependent exoDNAse (exonuclease V) beta subunit|nr:UvrD-helicase domain-containing protein [Solirubrobacteraceae bacterium]